MVNDRLNGIKLFEFQEEAVSKLLDITANRNAKQKVIMKAPTGSGKTIILIDYIDKYLNSINANTAFIWLCPGKGNLEEQSKNKMDQILPSRKTQTIYEALLSGFQEESITFINWEMVTKTGNRAILDSEQKNLFERIKEAERKNIEFVIIIDEEHSNNTAKANNIIEAFYAKNIIRVSATAIKNSNVEYFEIDEIDVITSGLITTGINVNEGLINNESIDDDYDVLLNLSDKKQKEIYARYKEINKNIKPLVLIQFPNAQPETIKTVESKLENLGYTYDNGMVAKWVSEEKINIDDSFTENDGVPIFLLMKQAISTGWDCPRAKILVKLREGMSESFEIQTIGRIRRMPEAKHYNDELLDNCYIYTFDEKYKGGLLSSGNGAYETRRLFLKTKCKNFVLEKENCNLDFPGLNERELQKKIYEHFKERYKLVTIKKENMKILEINGFKFERNIASKITQGIFKKTDSLADKEVNKINIKEKIKTKEHGFELLNAIDKIKKAIVTENKVVTTVLNKLFRDIPLSKYKLLSLKNKDFYAFVINNKDKLNDEFKEVAQHMSVQESIVLKTKKTQFRIPKQDFFKYDSGVKNEVIFSNNAYENYTSGMATSLVRSTSEMLFEKHCENRDDIEWVYKNGDKGKEYFSIVYIDGVSKQRLFYADYIVMKKDGTVWIIETKGGEFKGQDKNIDRQIFNKFNAFKNYAKDKDIQWGFVRDKDNELYINNTEYYKDMSNDNWVPLTDKF